MLLWHGTDEQFEVFDTDTSFGAHFGTERAARERLKRTNRDVDGAGPAMFLVEIQNALLMTDLGTWTFNSVARDLRLMKVLSPAEVAVAYDAWNVSDSDGWKALKQLLGAKGYDGVVYTNAVEHAGADSWIAFNGSQVKPFVDFEAPAAAPRVRERMR